MPKLARCFAMFVLLAVFGVLASTAAAERPPGQYPPGGRTFKKPLPAGDLLSRSGLTDSGESTGESESGSADGGGGSAGANAFVNDPCLDPAPTDPFPLNFFDTVQSETEIAVLNKVGGADDDDNAGGSGQLMVAGYNDSRGFGDNRQGLSGFSYSTDGGAQWIDASGLPPLVPAGAPAGTLGQDAYFGDPVVVVHHKTTFFYYASLYQTPLGESTISVNRGQFRVATQQVPVESKANTRCEGNPALHGVPDPPETIRERIIWEPPVEAVPPAPGPDLTPGTNDDDFLDKEWLYVDQNTGTIYVTYTRFEGPPAFGTPIEVAKCTGCANNPSGPLVFSPPTVIVPNEAFEFNQATQPFTTPTGRVIVTWFAREFDTAAPFPEIEQRIEYAYSDNDAATFTPEQLVAVVNPQGEPLGYNRARPTILNAPNITVDRGSDDGTFTSQETKQAGFGNVYITYFSGKTPLGSETKAADIFLSTSTNNGTSFGPPVKVNDDNTPTVHVFPTVQANKHGDVYVGWTDRRTDPTNVLNLRYAARSSDRGATFGHNKVQDDVEDSWFARADARPNFGDYDSSELLGFNQFVMTWSEGKFPALGQAGPSTDPLLRQTTPDTVFTISQGLGGGGG